MSESKEKLEAIITNMNTDFQIMGFFLGKIFISLIYVNYYLNCTIKKNIYIFFYFQKAKQTEFWTLTTLQNSQS